MREILDHLDRTRDEQLRTLERFVNQDSGTYDRDDVNRLGAMLAEALGEAGFTVTTIPQAKYGDHLLADKPGAGKKRLLFVSHFDTVFPHGTAKERPFRIDGDRAYGPGVLDMKSGIVCVLYALKALRAADSRAWREADIAWFLNSDEEILSPTSREHIQAHARRAHTVGVTEPARAGGEYVVCRKGAGKFSLEVAGRSAHAGAQPELGRSAILELAHKTVALHALTNFEEGTTVNVGVFRAGERSNVVADKAYAEIDLRAWTPEAANRAIRQMREIAETSTVPDTTARFWGELSFPPWPPGKPETMRLLAILQEVGRGLGFDLQGIPTGGGSDGNHTAHIAPTIDGLGAQGSRAHSPDEFMLVATLLERSKVNALFVERWYETWEVK
jgi:glutamate carboxypeptidase